MVLVVPGVQTDFMCTTPTKGAVFTVAKLPMVTAVSRLPPKSTNTAMGPQSAYGAAQPKQEWAANTAPTASTRLKAQS